MSKFEFIIHAQYTTTVSKPHKYWGSILLSSSKKIPSRPHKY